MNTDWKLAVVKKGVGRLGRPAIDDGESDEMGSTMTKTQRETTRGLELAVAGDGVRSGAMRTL